MKRIKQLIADKAQSQAKISSLTNRIDKLLHTSAGLFRAQLDDELQTEKAFLENTVFELNFLRSRTEFA